MPDPEEILFPRRKERFEDRRREGQQRKLLDEFFDHATLITISRLVSRGAFAAIDYPISTGKEGGVFRATAADGFRAVKVYRVGNSVFRRLPPHVLEDLKREASLGNFGRLVTAWTRREHTILGRLTEAEVRAPRPFGHARNVLVMEFVGTDGLPAPKLQSAVIADPARFASDLVGQVRRMVTQAGLVHGDLSPYNVLLHDDRPVLIDVAQSIPVKHPAARGLLERDCTNFAKYLARLGVDTSPAEFFRAAGGDALPTPEV